MKYTSAEAAKLLRKLNEEKNNVLEQEKVTKEFLAAPGENVDSVRPAYDYGKTQETLQELDRKIRVVKHAINAFNLVTDVPGTGMTIDQVLILIPQLTAAKQKLAKMQGKLPKQRESVNPFARGNSNMIDYRYTNYDIEMAKKDYAMISDKLARVQTALDLVNSTETMEISL